MERKRKPFQGVLNIIRFNWHFYLGAGVVLSVVALLADLLPPSLYYLALVASSMAIIGIIMSLFVSWYVYDVSDLYRLKWLEQTGSDQILNIHAGFDETSEIIQGKLPKSTITICDFYDPAQHTELSIKRARLMYPVNPKTVAVKTGRLPFAEDTFDTSITILSAHEIRAIKERVQFFGELRRVTKTSGKIIVTEHLRDWPNFLAYTIGFLHFHSRRSWLETFEQANLIISQEIKSSPFVTTFILKKNGNTL